jgi:arylsulfatase A-like enzyme
VTHWRYPLAGFDRSRGYPPSLHVNLIRYTGVLTSEPLELDEEGHLEFVPVVFGARRTACEAQVEVVGAEGVEIVWTGEPVFVAKGRTHGLFGRLADPVGVVLAPRDRSFQLRWQVRGGCEGVEAGLARPILRGAPQPRPPVLFACSDTHRYDRAFGAGAGLMPRLQEMTQYGVAFDRAYSNASWTLPSIASTLTGLHPRFHRTGERVESGRRSEWDPERRLPPGQFQLAWGQDYHVFTAHPRSLPNLGERLREYGYETAAIVANTLYVGSGLLAEGFDLVVDANGRPGKDVNLLAQQLIERAGKGRPMFLLVHYMDVHEYIGWGKRPGDPGGTRASLRAEDIRTRYERQVRVADEHIGRLVSAWNSGVGLKHSFVAFYSDHGEHLREPTRATHTHGDSMDEELLHVPLMVRYPKAMGVAQGREEQPVSLVDLVPTVLEVVGAHYDPATLHGQSLLASGTTGRRIFADYQLAGDELASVRDGPLKLVLNLTQGSRTLFGVQPSAPSKERRLEDFGRATALEAEFAAYRKRAEAATAHLVSDHAVDEEFEKRLRAIGYIE